MSKIEYWKVRAGPQGGAFLYKSLLSILLPPPPRNTLFKTKLEGNIVTNYKTIYSVNAILKLKWNWRWILTQAVKCMTWTLLPLLVMGETGQWSCHCFHDHVGNMLRIFKKLKRKLLRRGRYFNLANHSTQKHGNLKSPCSPNEGIRSKKIVAKMSFKIVHLIPTQSTSASHWTKFVLFLTLPFSR